MATMARSTTSSASPTPFIAIWSTIYVLTYQCSYTCIMVDMNTTEAPIGYWLKHLDELIEAHFDRTLAGHDLGRRHWQTLNMLSPGPLDGEHLEKGLRPFWTDGSITLNEVTQELIRRSWVARRGDGLYALTAAGEAGF